MVTVTPDAADVGTSRRLSVDEIEGELAGTREAFAYWFRIAFDEMRVRGWTVTGPPVSVP